MILKLQHVNNLLRRIFSKENSFHAVDLEGKVFCVHTVAQVSTARLSSSARVWHGLCAHSFFLLSRFFKTFSRSSIGVAWIGVHPATITCSECYQFSIENLLAGRQIQNWKWLSKQIKNTGNSTCFTSLYIVPSMPHVFISTYQSKSNSRYSTRLMQLVKLRRKAITSWISRRQWPRF